MSRRPLPLEFYDRPVVDVARDLIGLQLLRATREGVVVGRIVEVEAYLAHGDPASHSHRGKTPRNASMFGLPGRAYVYSIHSRFCVNVVTEPRGVATAILIRAIEPVTGVELMKHRRVKQSLFDLTRGPGRLCQAMNIDRRLDGWDLTRGERLWIEAAVDERAYRQRRIVTSPRIGISTAQDLPLRMLDETSRFVSRPRFHRERASGNSTSKDAPEPL